jgi:hypothetical protein
MPHLTSSKRLTAATAAIVLVLVGLLLAACGGSSSGSTTTSTSASASTTTPTTPAGSPATRGRFTAFRACLEKNGITLPKRTRGSRPTGGFLGGGAPSPTLPKGVTRAQYEAAVKKCGGQPGGFKGGFKGGPKGAIASSPAAKEALTKFAACMRENGVNLPAPNTTGKGPVFDTNGLDATGSKFRAAEVKCSADLRDVFRRPGGTPGGAGA